MKKIFTTILLMLFTFLLVSCDEFEVNNNLIKIEFLVEEKVIYTEKIEKGSSFTYDLEPEKEDHTFLGWYGLEDNTKYTNKSKLFSNLKLFAKFKNNLAKDPIYDIFYLNDTHGAVLRKDNELGLSYIANYINKSKDDNSIFITGGDIFQGQLISNQNKGEILIEILNELKLDAFVIGNHEFDWGLEEILKYFSPNNNIKANFPLLGANVIVKATNKRPEYIDTHTIIERNGSKIGIIGVIGDGLESSIASQKVRDYKFTDAYSAVRDVAKEIEDEVDFIIVATHGNDNYFNERVGRLNKVSAIFNGHSHQAYTGLIDNKIPFMQSGRYSEKVGHMNLEFDDEFNLLNSSTNNINSHPYLNEADLDVENIINRYYEQLKYLYEDEIIMSQNYMGQNELANFIARLMAEVTNSVAGFQNSGGTRSTFNQGQNITAADVFQVFPFDNEIIYVKVTGKILKNMLSDSYFISYSNINYQDIIDNELYQIATNDYIYYHDLNGYRFKGTEGNLYGDMYESFYEVLINLKNAGYESFNINSPIIK